MSGPITALWFGCQVEIFPTSKHFFFRNRLWNELHPIMPCPTGRFFAGALSEALRARPVMSKR
jgi:hypothetical protein